jgi:hypothetical protein
MTIGFVKGVSGYVKKAEPILFIDHQAKWMIWEADPDQATVIKLKSIEVKSLVFDP